MAGGRGWLWASLGAVAAAVAGLDGCRLVRPPAPIGEARSEALVQAVQSVAALHGVAFAVRFEVASRDSELARAARAWDASWNGAGEVRAAGWSGRRRAAPEDRIARELGALGLIASPAPGGHAGSPVRPGQESEDVGFDEAGGLAAFDPAAQRVVVSGAALRLCLPPASRPASPAAGLRDRVCPGVLHAVAHAFVERELGGASLRAAADSSGADRALALRGMVEGDAALAELAGGASGAADPRPSAAPGASAERDVSFATQLARAARDAGLDYARDALRAGGPGRLVDALLEPPGTTFALLHPDPGRDEPASPKLPPTASPLALETRGYRLALQDSIGELAVRTLLRRAGDPGADGVARAWLADTVYVLTFPAGPGSRGGPPAALWLSRWSSPAAAAAFEGAIVRVAAAARSALMVGRRGDLVVVLAHVPVDLAGPIRDDMLSVLAREYAEAAARVAPSVARW